MSFLLPVFIINLLVISPCPYLPVFNLQYHWRNVDFEYSSREWRDHLGILGFVASPRQYSNKSESSNYTANGDLAIKSGFVNVVSSAILNSQAGYRCTLVPRLPFPVTSFSNIPFARLLPCVRKNSCRSNGSCHVFEKNSCRSNGSYRAFKKILAVHSNKRKKIILCFVEPEIWNFKTSCHEIVKRIGYYLYCHTSSFVKMRE